jgi:hypothetical protein
MAMALALAVSIWLWLGMVPQLALGSRRRRPPALVREWLTGPVGMFIALGHRHDGPAH